MQKFGGNWTDEKLERLKKYLTEYVKILKKTPYKFAYIDAFAGTGYREVKTGKTNLPPLFPEITQKESQRLLEGSARIALRIEPSFMKYIFIEKDEKRFKQLQKLREEFPHLADRISLINEDCNAFLQDRCHNYKWTKHRAVLFLDPFGMQVEWDTMKAIADTKAIDLWILFPLGVAVNRLLKKDGNIEDSWCSRLDLMFGTHEWYSEFYKQENQQTLFGESTKIIKVCSLESISNFYIQRLKTIFVKVAEKPYSLCNSKGNPLFQLCFAASNPRGAPTALKIAEYILKV
jgi:three-Cys-motif partner protein